MHAEATRLILHFTRASSDPADKRAQEIVMALAYSNPGSLYVQDHSYFRKAAGVEPTAIIKCEIQNINKDPAPKSGEKRYRYGCASVCVCLLQQSPLKVPSQHLPS